jgi:hypothetical protein
MNNNRENNFGKSPEGRPELSEHIKRNGGWTGFQTPYSEVLGTTFFDYHRKSKADLVLVDIGCGWGEHVTLAGLGNPSQDIPKVKKAIGIGIDQQEIKTARLIASFAQLKPDLFRRIMTATNTGIHLGRVLSPIVENFKSILKDSKLNTELKNLLDANSEDELSNFLSTHLKIKPIKKGLESAPESGLQNHVEFIDADIYNPPLPDNFADRIICCSVAGYIEIPENESAMWKNILRITKPNGIINVMSFEYEREGLLTSGPAQLTKKAEQLNIKIEEVRNMDSFQKEPTPHWRRQSIYKIIEKPN